MKDKKHKILFALESDALIVANTGEPFSREGVISICNMDLSSKDADKSRGPEGNMYKKAPDNALVGAILKECLRVYKNVDRLKEDAHSEERIEQSYDGRFIWELLQNADDAADDERTNAHLIGAKGLGFKSVLEITKEPEIYSGEFDFCFSEEKSRGKLQDVVAEWREEYEIPVCRLPHHKARDGEVQKHFGDGYASVIRLPLSAENQENVKRKLDDFCASTLLFCQRIELVEIRSGGDVRRIHVHRSKDGRTIELHDNGECECWRVWRARKDVGGEKQLSVSVCLPVIDQEVWHCEEVPFLNVFFPTAEQITNVHALVHVSCEVESNRQRLASRQTHEAAICEMLECMTKEILLEVPPNAAIGAFGGATGEGAGSKMVMRLGESIAKSVCETAFIPVIGGGRALPGDVLLWKYGLGDVVSPGKVRGKNLCEMEIQDNDDSVCILSELGAQDMTIPEHADFLYFCKKSTKDECLHTWGVAQSLMQNAYSSTKEKCANALRKAPFWWTRTGRARAIESDIPLTKKKPKNCPDWLPVHIVDHGFLRLVEKEKKRREENGDWEDALSGEVAPLASKREYFDHILLPYCKKKPFDWWQKNGWKILEVASMWGGTGDAKDGPFIVGVSSDKEKRAKIIHLPIGKDAADWAPAWQCYAGAAWGGPEMFDYFADIEDRFVLSPPKNWKVDVSAEKRQSWKTLLSWLGCAWTPVMFRQKKLCRGQNYISTRPDDELDFYFEHFSEMLPHAQSSDHVALLEMGHAMYGLAKSTRAECFYHRPRQGASWALLQLQNEAWVPCKQSLLYPTQRFFAPRDAYLPKCSLGGMFPEVDMRGLEKSHADVGKTLEDLGAHRRIPDDPAKLADYMGRLSKSAEQGGMNLWWKGGKGAKRGRVARAAKAVFEAYEKIDSPPALGEAVMVPCLRQVREGVLICFKEAGAVCWADQPYFAELEVRREILKNQELHVFFLFLDKGKKFGLKPLSDHLEMQLEDGKNRQNLPKEGERMRATYKERRFGLAQATGTELPEQLRVVAYDNITLRSNVFLDISAEIKFWEENGYILINAGRTKNMWQSLAAALGRVGKCPEYKSDFEILLSASKWEDFVARLRDDYGLSEDSIEEVQDHAPAESDRFEITEHEVEPRLKQDADRSADTSTSSQHDISRDREYSRREAGDSADGGVADMSRRSEPAGIPQLEEVELNDPPVSGRRGRSAPGGNGSRGHRESEADEKSGRRGEQALLQWLRDKHAADHVIDKNETNPNHPGYDILVKKSNGENVYYECKSFVTKTQPRTVELTEAQFNRAQEAKEAGERYVLCVIYDLDGNSAKMLRIDPVAFESAPHYRDVRYRIDLASPKS